MTILLSSEDTKQLEACVSEILRRASSHGIVAVPLPITSREGTLDNRSRRLIKMSNATEQLVKEFVQMNITDRVRISVS